MLILTRKSGEKIAIGDDIVITLLEIKGNQVKLGIEAPKHVDIHRQEVYERIMEENLRSAAADHKDVAEALLLIQQNQKEKT